MNRSIRKLSRTVTPHTATPEAMQAENEMLVVEGPASVGADASAVLRSVVSFVCIGRGRRAARLARKILHAGEYAIPEAVEDSEYFVVSKAGIESQFGDNIGRGIEGVIRS